MRYQSQNDLIDPDVPAPETDLESGADHDPDAPNDAYVIGDRGNTVQAPDVIDAKSANESQLGPKPWVKPAGAVLGVLFVGMTIWNLSRLLQDPPPPPSPSPFQVKQALYLGVMKIEAYRRQNGVTPRSLADAGVVEAGAYDYKRIDPSRYVVSFRGNGPNLEYDSNVPKDRFFGTPEEILSIGASK